MLPWILMSPNLECFTCVGGRDFDVQHLGQICYASLGKVHPDLPGWQPIRLNFNFLLLLVNQAFSSQLIFKRLENTKV